MLLTLHDYLPVAKEIFDTILPVTHRRSLVGDLRRGIIKPTKIDFLVEPIKIEQKDLFDNVLDAQYNIQPMIDALKVMDTVLVAVKESHYRFVTRKAIELNIYVHHSKDQWGFNLIKHTGSNEFLEWATCPRSKGGALPSSAHIKNNGVYQGKTLITMPYEIHFLNFIGMGWVEPKKRHSGMMLQNSGGTVADG